VPVTWGDKDILQKVAIPGVGNSSPIISKGRLFVQSAREDGSERMLLCYDAATMKRLWTASVPGKPGRTHKKNTLASSTPAADGERIYAEFWDGESISLHAFDYLGKELWNVPLGSFTSQHGAGHSPVAHAGKVFLNNDQDGHAELMSFDASTGKKLWSVERRAFRTCYSSPIVMNNTKGGSEIVISSTAGLAGYDPDTGTCNWHWDWAFDGMALRTVGSAVVGDGLIFAVSGDGNGDRHMVAVRTGGQGDVTSTHLAWAKKKGTAYVPCPVFYEGYVYWISDQGFATCCEAKTGNVIWTERLSSSVTASLILVNGNIYCEDERGTVFVFAAHPKFELLQKASLGEEVYATPAVADGRLYIRGREHLFVIGER
jgi:outer membrane protein assembly factor BamB